MPDQGKPMPLVAGFDRPSFARAFTALIAVVVWSALVLQYGLLIEATRDDIGPWWATLRFFSFFTVLSNLLVALVASRALAGSRVRGRFLEDPRVRGAAALCIGITCGIYHFVLAATWSPQGAQRLADLALHYAVPSLYLAWWLGCAEHGRLAWIDALRWLLFPLLFLTWVLVRGRWLHEYPYPFLDVDALGVGLVVRNAFAIGVLFVLAGFALVALDRRVLRSG